MGPLFGYSLLPVVSIALLLAFSAALSGRSARGLALYCLSVAVWSGALFLICLPRTAFVGERLAAVGAFTAAGYLHTAYDVTEQRSYRLVWLAYAIALAITLAGVLSPGALYGPRAMRTGPLFWPAMALSVAAAVLPLWRLAQAYPVAARDKKRHLRTLLVAGVLGNAGGMGNALLLAHGVALPFGMFVVLAALLVLGNVIREHQSPGERRLLDRSLLYSAVSAILSAVFLFGVTWIGPRTGAAFLAPGGLGAFFLLLAAALAFEPLRQQLQESLGRRLFPGRAPSADLARALATQEARADQSSRLAEVGVLTSAVAHEVRNPLGVLSAHLRLLEMSGASGETIAAMREQIERAGRFVQELLRYGRPDPLELRLVDLGASVDLALSTARQGLGAAAPDGVEVDRRIAPEAPGVEADQRQISQLLVILIENALLELAEATDRRLRISAELVAGKLRLSIEDTGRGVPPEVLPRLFEPFVSGRRREGPRPGTGLGLAIARRIVERHAGAISVGRSTDLGGARFDVELPQVQTVLAAATARE